MVIKEIAMTLRQRQRLRLRMGLRLKLMQVPQRKDYLVFKP